MVSSCDFPFPVHVLSPLSNRKLITDRVPSIRPINELISDSWPEPLIGNFSRATKIFLSVILESA